MKATLAEIDQLDRVRILHALHQAGDFACDLQVFEQIDSSNAWLLQQCREGVALPLACIADSQSAGRGRRGRVWHSPAGSNIYLSLGWEFDREVNELGAFSLLIGVALARVLKQVGIAQVKLKWPNDVLVENKKLAGILIETQNRKEGGLAVVIGVGLNYRMSDEDRAQIDQLCTDVDEWLGPGGDRNRCDRNQLVALLLAECMAVCRGFPHNRKALLDEYSHEYDVLKDQDVMIQDNSGQQQAALALGVADDGAMRVQIDGVEQRLVAADVSLRRSS